MVNRKCWQFELFILLFLLLPSLLLAQETSVVKLVGEAKEMESAVPLKVDVYNTSPLALRLDIVKERLDYLTEYRIKKRRNANVLLSIGIAATTMSSLIIGMTTPDPYSGYEQSTIIAMSSFATVGGLSSIFGFTSISKMRKADREIYSMKQRYRTLAISLKLSGDDLRKDLELQKSNYETKILINKEKIISKKIGLATTSLLSAAGYLTAFLSTKKAYALSNKGADYSSYIPFTIIGYSVGPILTFVSIAKARRLKVFKRSHANDQLDYKAYQDTYNSMLSMFPILDVKTKTVGLGANASF